ncbi:hypothetical protein P9112_008254 [Eukaryota sp. TZLM1-RC]
MSHLPWSQQQLYGQLISMGFSPGEVDLALRTNSSINTLDQAITEIESLRSQVSTQAAPATSTAQPVSQPSTYFPYNDMNAPHQTEDQELQQAIKASLSTHIQAQQADQTEDIELQKAIESSMQQSHTPQEDPNPLHRRRSEGTPAGLRNVGNSCYLASICQTFYHVYFIRKTILEYAPPHDYTNSKDLPAINVVLELQRTFAFLRLSNRSYYTPTKLAEAITKAANTYDGFSALIPGQQNDATEFLLRLLELLEIGLGNDDVTKIFRGNSVDIVECTDPNNQQKTLSKTVEPFVFLNLPLDYGDLLSAMDSKADPSVVPDYVLPAHHSRPTIRTLIDSFGDSAVCFALQRYSYNFESNSTIKRYDKFGFPLSFEGNRWRSDYISLIDDVHSQHHQLKRQLFDAQKSLSDVDNYKGKGISLFEILGLAENFCRNPSEILVNIRPTEFSTLQTLQSMSAVVKSESDKRRSVVENLESQISRLYDPLSGDTFHLFSILVHQGSSLSGHFWNYIAFPNGHCLQSHFEGDTQTQTFESTTEAPRPPNPESRYWYKFNDQFVSRADETQLLHESFGDGKALGSAYFLVYLRPAAFHAFYGEAMVPLHLQQEVEQDNAAFDCEIQTWQNRHAPPDSHHFVNLVAKKSTEVQQTWDDFRRRGGFPDPRISSLPVYLLSLGDLASEMVGQVISREVWLEEYPEKDLSDIRVRSELDRVLGNQRSILTNLEDLGEHYRSFLAFSNMAYHFHQALEDVLTERPMECISHLTTALQLSCKVSESVSMNLLDHVKSSLRVVLFKCYNNSLLNLSRSKTIPNLLDKGTTTICQVIHSSKYLGESDWFVLFLNHDVMKQVSNLQIPDVVKNTIAEAVTYKPPAGAPSRIDPLNKSQLEGLDKKISDEVVLFEQRNREVLIKLKAIEEEFSFAVEDTKDDSKPMSPSEGAGLGMEE